MSISWQKLQELENKYGDSFYILDIRKFEHNYREFLSCFQSIYPLSNIGYSYKTNYTPQLCKSVQSLGGYAEVVSQMEYDLAIRIGVPPSRIIFNGPLKINDGIENAILAGSIVNLDSVHEVSMVKEIAAKYPEKVIAVGLRCNFDIGFGVSRFGLDVEGGDLEFAFNTISQLKNCSILGFHCHFSTPQKNLESYALRTKKMLELCRLYFPDNPPKFLDLGGGFFGKMSEEFQQQFDYHIFSYQEYAEVIASQFANYFSPIGETELILEPGLALVADAMQFVVKIADVKTIRSRKVALSTGSVQNIKPNLHNKNLPITVYKDTKKCNLEQLADCTDIVGYTCLEYDCLYKNYQGKLSVSDYVVFENVGAYITVFKPPFIRYCPAIVLYDSNSDKFELIKRKEEFQDIFETYIF
jgi:diaminopimelate decarboxylase